MKGRGILGAIALCGVVAAWGMASHAQGPKPPAENPFAGKILIVEFVSYNHGTLTEYLKDVEVREVGGRTFLVGTNLDSLDEAAFGGARVWLAMNTIQSIAECRDIEDFRERKKRLASANAAAVPAPALPPARIQD